ncbi:RNA polymerase II transcription factor SIII subunit A-domain-containing protein [Pyronema omphalodes]|nr:RNA polymerase II transcription factor SIII subunit A-domain-containing protein [Pyronema omphalodes]KAI5818322.1 RNA polymerase II transcription factor SIII subunit A-domain-containing protein [Pyronema omphalodes]
MLGEKNGPKDLRKLAEKVLIKHKAEIISVGEIAYNVIYPVLRSIDSAPQLKIIEKNSPHICYEDQELWKKLITKDFGPGALSKFKLEDNNRWSALYDKHREEQAREHDRVARSMKKVMEATEAQKKTMTTKLDRTLVMPARKGRSTGDGWGARNNWDAKVGIKIKDIVKKSKIEADQVALRNKSAKKPVAHAQINPNMAEALRMRHQNRVELTTNASKKRTHTEEPPHKTSPPKKARTTGLEPRTQPKIATKEDRRQKDVSQPLRLQDGRPHEARTQQERTQQHHSQQDRHQQDRHQQDRRQQDRHQQDRRIDSDRRRDSEKHYYGDRRNDSDRRIDNRQHPYRRT